MYIDNKRSNAYPIAVTNQQTRASFNLCILLLSLKNFNIIQFIMIPVF